MMKNLSEEAREEYLRAHFVHMYGVHVEGLEQLVRGVVRVDLQDGRRWIARVFSAERALEQVEGDAAMLQLLEQQSFPAERCADKNPVSVLHGRGILITEYIEGTEVGEGKRTLARCGELLARLHLLPVPEGEGARSAGALHHYVRNGGSPQNELEAARNWLAAIEDRIPHTALARYDALREQLAGADTCHDLSQALIHPDAVLKNLLLTASNDLVFIDWTGAGYGPRLASLAVLIWSCALHKGKVVLPRVDAVVAGYRSYTRLGHEELERLAGVMYLRPLVFACWRYRHAILADRVPDGTEWWWPDKDLARTIAERACSAFQA